MTTSTSYDEVLYPSYVHTQTHPDRLATLATLFGMQPVAVPSARILELACGPGSNLIPLATSYPNSRCLGIDFSSRQVALGQHIIQALGLTNVELRTQSILDFSLDEGQFDYIIAHGVFSWVPENVRDKILRICREHLAPQGVAIVSYNTFPGWHQRRMIRDMMRFHTKAFTEPTKKIEQAKAFLSFMTKAVPDDSAYGRSLHEELRSLTSVEESYLFHEQLEEVNEPMYFHEFADQAAQHGLQYLSEVELSNLQLERYPEPVAQVLAKMPVVEREQYLDFLLRRTFRQTLLCRQEIALDRTNLGTRAGGLRVASPLLADKCSGEILSDQPLVLEGHGGAKLTIRDRLIKAAFAVLAEAWPHSIAMTELQSAVRRKLADGAVIVQSEGEFQRDSKSLTHSLVQAFILGVVQLQVAEPSFAVELSDIPQACPLARYQARSGNRVTNRQHRSVLLDPISRQILILLDGTTDRATLQERLVQFVVDEKIAIQKDGRVISSLEEIRSLVQTQLESSLHELRRQALLVIR